MIDSCHGLGLGHGSRVMRFTGQLTDGSRWSRVTKCDRDPLSALSAQLVIRSVIQSRFLQRGEASASLGASNNSVRVSNVDRVAVLGRGGLKL